MHLYHNCTLNKDTLKFVHIQCYLDVACFHVNFCAKPIIIREVKDVSIY